MDGTPSVISFERVFHTGVLVPDIDAATAASAEATGARWCAIREVDQPMWIPGSAPTRVPIRVTFSRPGPHRIELIEGPPGSLWDGHARPGTHHVALWVDELVSATDAMEARGWELVGAHKTREVGYGVATYLRAAGLEIVELVDTKIQPVLESWWAEEEESSR